MTMRRGTYQRLIKHVEKVAALTVITHDHLYLGADHRGFALKEKIKTDVARRMPTLMSIDLGASSLMPDDDYPDYAKAVGEAIAKNFGKVRVGDDGDCGIVVCGSGFGADIAANKMAGIRSALPMSPDHAYVARHDDDANVLALAADFLDEAAAEKIVKTFLSTPFAHDEERYRRRLDKIAKLEERS
jgi:ribose 5-phosphate isomerase B